MTAINLKLIYNYWNFEIIIKIQTVFYEKSFQIHKKRKEILSINNNKKEEIHKLKNKERIKNIQFFFCQKIS